MANSLDMWLIQLDELVQHALKIRDDNVMEYKGKELKAFDMGLNMFILLMKSMAEDMVGQKGVDHE